MVWRRFQPVRFAVVCVNTLPHLPSLHQPTNGICAQPVKRILDAAECLLLSCRRGSTATYQQAFHPDRGRLCIICMAPVPDSSPDSTVSQIKRTCDVLHENHDALDFGRLSAS